MLCGREERPFPSCSPPGGTTQENLQRGTATGVLPTLSRHPQRASLALRPAELTAGLTNRAR